MTPFAGFKQASLTPNEFQITKSLPLFPGFHWDPDRRTNCQPSATTSEKPRVDGLCQGLTQARIAPRAEPGHGADEASSESKLGLNYDH